MAENRKRPGIDWTIVYMDVASGQISEMAVFGAADIIAACQDAMQNLTVGEVVFDLPPDRYEILAAIREDQSIPQASKSLKDL